MIHRGRVRRGRWSQPGDKGSNLLAVHIWLCRLGSKRCGRGSDLREQGGNNGENRPLGCWGCGQVCLSPVHQGQTVSPIRVNNQGWSSFRNVQLQPGHDLNEVWHGATHHRMSESMHSINNYLTCALSMHVQQENYNFSRFSRLKRDSPSAMGVGELTFLSRNSYLLSLLNRLKSCHHPPRIQQRPVYMVSHAF